MRIVRGALVLAAAAVLTLAATTGPPAPDAVADPAATTSPE
ncbi:hypothetical protein WIS52_01985 [Pseudonocardia nematodicida]|uniref:Uncharacterized protein n=1 Tax=Pseudonocardia nematodicida TaxID=1206997 RepID=A0ABV1K441_9PSEU